MIQLDEDVNKPIIKVIGVGGGGGNAANFMFKKGIQEVDFVICNTDKKALNQSPIPVQVMLGQKGLGAGSKPEIGRQAAIESLPEIQEILKDSTEMVFVTAGMGGGTGTGAAPVIAKAAKDMGILTIGIVTIPFVFEGRKRVMQALEGLQEMRKSVDAIIIITNERIKELYGDLTMSKAFSMADTVLATAAKGIAELITVTGYVNVDLEDVRTVLTDSGDAIMGSAIASGEDRAITAIKEALNSPLLINSDISSSENVLLNISSGIDENEVTMDEVSEITGYLEEHLKDGAQIIWGNTHNEELEDKLQVTVVVTGLNINDDEVSSAKPVAKAEKPSHVFGGLFDNLTSSKQNAEKTRPASMSQEQVAALSQEVYGYNVMGGKKETQSSFVNPEPEVVEPVVAAPVPNPTPVQAEAPITIKITPAEETPVIKPQQQPKKRISLSDLLNDPDQAEKTHKRD